MMNLKRIFRRRTGDDSKRMGINRKIIISLLTLVIFSSSVIMYNVVIREVNSFYSNDITSQKEQEFEELWVLIKETHAKAQISSKKTADKIQSDIKEKCDMEDVKTCLTSGNIDQALEDIFRTNIQGNYFTRVHNDSNDIFLSTSTRIIADYSYDSVGSSLLKDYAKTHYNKELGENAIKKLLFQSDEFIVWERNPSPNPDHIKYDYITKDRLKTLYLKEGLAGFMEYEFLVPSYITQYGDIFGAPDIVQGKRAANNKIYVVQQFNIYDIISEYYPDQFTGAAISRLNVQYDIMIINLYLLAIFLSIAIIGVMIVIYNTINQCIADKALLESSLRNKDDK